MKKISKKQKIILIFGIISIIIFGFRPALEQIEMRKVNIVKPEYIEIYIRSTKDVEIPKSIQADSSIITHDGYRPHAINFKKNTINIAGIKQDGSECVSWEWSDCLPKDSYRLLNTDNDKELIKNVFSENKNLKYNSLEFNDYNQDGIDDVYIKLRCHKICDPGEAESYLYSIYSVSNDRLLWGFSHNTISGEGQAPDIQFFNNNTKFPTIVIFTPGRSLLKRSNYDFFKYSDSNKEYLLKDPLREDWKNYWQNISTLELSSRVFGFWGLLLLIFLLLTLSTLLFIIILVLIVKFCILKTVSRVKLKNLKSD